MTQLAAPPCSLAHDAYFVHRSCVCNHINALYGRVGSCVPYPQQSSLGALEDLAFVLGRLVGKHSPVPASSIVQGFKGKKRRRYEDAERELNATGVRSRHTKVKMFVKQEGVRFLEDKINPSCRAIQFADFVYILEHASLIKAAEHALYDVEGDGKFFPRGRFIAKGMTPTVRARTLHEKAEGMPGCTIYEFDASRFDAHITEDLLKIEEKFWRLVLGGGRKMRERLDRIMRSRTTIRGGFRVGDEHFGYSCRGGRCSGSADTAASNCVQMSIQLSSFVVWLKQNWDADLQFDYLVDGDDSVFFYKGRPFTETMVKEFFKENGLTMKIEGVRTDLREVNFCQSKPCRINGRWTSVRDPVKIMSKTLTNMKFEDEALRPKLLKTIALGELSIFYGSPVIDKFLRRLIAGAEAGMSNRGKRDGGILRGDFWMTYRQQRDIPIDFWRRDYPSEVTPQAREDFAVAWGISVEEQLRIEENLSEWTPSLIVSHRGEPVDSRAWEFDFRRPEIPSL